MYRCRSSMFGFVIKFVLLLFVFVIATWADEKEILAEEKIFDERTHHSATSFHLESMTTSNHTGRAVTKVLQAIEAEEGQGARVKRTIGAVIRNFDPFLMLDEFFVEPPAGFPNHPHRGFETVTYMLDGKFKHRDNKGHSGEIGPGDVQWMTAGSGLVHSEMPATNGVNHGLQLWVNLAKKDKMTAPNYQELPAAKIPNPKADGVSVHIIAGEALGEKAPIYTRTPAMYIDVELKAGKSYRQAIPSTFNAFCYVLSGTGEFGSNKKHGKASQMIITEASATEQHLDITATTDLRFVIVGGEPINEPVVQHGPFVMNTREEIMQAITDYQAGKF